MRTLIAALFFFCFASVALADPLPVGSASWSTTTGCPTSTGLPADECLLVSTTQCPLITDLAARVKVTNPPIGVTLIGTVTWTAGGGGTGYYEQSYGNAPSPATNMLAALRNEGYRLVQIAWNNPPSLTDGWMSGANDVGVARLGCRPATAMRAIRARYPSGVLCGSGQSGGAIAVSLDLARYGSTDMAAAIITGGPPMGRNDYACASYSSTLWAAWLPICRQWSNQPGWDQSCGCLSSSPTCTNCSCYAFDHTHSTVETACRSRLTTQAQWDQWRSESVYSTDAILSYPTTNLRFIVGANDTSEAVPLGWVYADATTGRSKTMTKIAGTTHAVASTQAGADAIQHAIEEACVTPPPPPPQCGNGILESGEQCDDDNTTSGDGCSAMCHLEYCGDSTIQPGLGEQCDDGNALSEDGCSSACLLERCGDGVRQAGLGEQCDDGNTANNDGCSATCLTELCGDGIVNNTSETCDDGNTTSGDGCSSSCTIEPPPPVCGNGILESGEECDDGNTNSNDGCSAACVIELCCSCP